MLYSPMHPTRGCETEQPMPKKIKVYMKKNGDYYEVYYTDPFSKETHPIHSVKDQAQAEMYLDGVMSGLAIARKMLRAVSETATRVPNDD